MTILKMAYFITIVTKDRGPFFGEIKNNTITLSAIGKFVESNFNIIRERINYIRITEWVIMPDHLHMIVVIDKINDYVGTRLEASSYNLEANSYGLHPLQKQSVPSFVNHLKGRIKRWCNENNFNDFCMASEIP
jgi:putative transposase